MRLIDADALKESIPETEPDIFENCQICTTLMDYEVKDLINKQPTIAAPRWVRCEEQLPPNDGKEVLVTDGFHVGIGICMYKWSKTKKWTQEAVWYKWNLNDYGYPMKKFKTDTHIKAWMPLPEPPKEDA